MLIAIAGLPGSGKSTIARHLSQVLPAAWLNKDRLRSALFPPSAISYTKEQDDFCFATLLRAAEHLLVRRPGRRVILDGRTFSRKRDLQPVLSLTNRLGEPLYLIQCECSDDQARKRIERDLADSAHLAANRNYELYLEVKARREPLDHPGLLLDTALDLGTSLGMCLNYLTSPAPTRK